MNTHRLHVALWAVALLAFGFGDTVTTSVGLQLGASEANPVVAPLVGHHGIYGIAAVKAAFLVAFAGVYHVVPRPSNVGVPAGLAALGVAVTTWNVVLLAGLVA